MKIVMVSGGFDPIHSGHISYLESARKMGDRLIVALNSDAWLINKNGKLQLINELNIDLGSNPEEILNNLQNKKIRHSM